MGSWDAPADVLTGANHEQGFYIRWLVFKHDDQMYASTVVIWYLPAMRQKEFIYVKPKNQTLRPSLVVQLLAI